jgi:hypothetical protein
MKDLTIYAELDTTEKAYFNGLIEDFVKDNNIELKKPGFLRYQPDLMVGVNYTFLNAFFVIYSEEDLKFFISEYMEDYLYPLDREFLKDFVLIEELKKAIKEQKALFKKGYLSSFKTLDLAVEDIIMNGEIEFFEEFIDKKALTDRLYNDALVDHNIFNTYITFKATKCAMKDGYFIAYAPDED